MPGTLKNIHNHLITKDIYTDKIVLTLSTISVTGAQWQVTTSFLFLQKMFDSCFIQSVRIKATFLSFFHGQLFGRILINRNHHLYTHTKIKSIPPAVWSQIHSLATILPLKHQEKNTPSKQAKFKKQLTRESRVTPLGGEGGFSSSDFSVQESLVINMLIIWKSGSHSHPK